MFKYVAVDDNQVVVNLKKPPRGVVGQSCNSGRLNCGSLTCQSLVLLFHCLEVTSKASSWGDHTALGRLLTKVFLDVEDFQGGGFAFLCHLPQWCANHGLPCRPWTSTFAFRLTPIAPCTKSHLEGRPSKCSNLFAAAHVLG